MLLGHASSIADNWAVMPYYFGVDSPISVGDFVRSYLDPSGDRRDAATRHEKTATNYLAIVHVACIMAWLD